MGEKLREWLSYSFRESKNQDTNQETYIVLVYSMVSGGWRTAGETRHLLWSGISQQRIGSMCTYAHEHATPLRAEKHMAGLCWVSRPGNDRINNWPLLIRAGMHRMAVWHGTSKLLFLASFWLFLWEAEQVHHGSRLVPIFFGKAYFQVQYRLYWILWLYIG